MRIFDSLLPHYASPAILNRSTERTKQYTISMVVLHVAQFLFYFVVRKAKMSDKPLDALSLKQASSVVAARWRAEKSKIRTRAKRKALQSEQKNAQMFLRRDRSGPRPGSKIGIWPSPSKWRRIRNDEFHFLFREAFAPTNYVCTSRWHTWGWTNRDLRCVHGQLPIRPAPLCWLPCM